MAAFESTKRPCTHCGVEFSTIPQTSGRFCSRLCCNRANVAKRRETVMSRSTVVYLPCVICGKLSPLNGRRVPKTKFCSRECRSKMPSRRRPLIHRVAVTRAAKRLVSVREFGDRFWQRVDRSSAEGCWEWTAARFPRGYGKVAMPNSRKLEGAHRVAWALTHGAIPDGLWVLHRCDNRPCCRPDHLFLGTCQDNVADMVAKGRHPSMKPSAV